MHRRRIHVHYVSLWLEAATELLDVAYWEAWSVIKAISLLYPQTVIGRKKEHDKAIALMLLFLVSVLLCVFAILLLLISVWIVNRGITSFVAIFLKCSVDVARLKLVVNFFLTNMDGTRNPSRSSSFALVKWEPEDFESLIQSMQFSSSSKW